MQEDFKPPAFPGRRRSILAAQNVRVVEAPALPVAVLDPEPPAPLPPPVIERRKPGRPRKTR